uniref:Bifunctional inhibitor/plant lipid transfer protein/seed storage helical domain-containing protein n=1 Tax=Oryza meridionalis TaxID=40149 RepID=A0A0E0E950_9ORYZ
MASNKVVFSVLLLAVVSVLAATATMAEYHHQDQVVYTPGQLCQPGLGYPMYPLPRCRALVKRQCVGRGTAAAEQVRRDCCRQLAAVDDSWCRCEAISHMLGGIYRELGAPDVGHPMSEVFRGCRRGDIERAAASLPAFCNVDIPNGVALLIVVVSVLAATTTMADHHQEQVVYTPGQLCQPGIGYPTYPLPRCRALVKRQCVAPGTADEQVRRGCCRQLAAIDSSWCRCDALNHMLRIIYRESGAADAGHPMAEVFRGCRRGDIERATASLPAFCNVDIPNGKTMASNKVVFSALLLAIVSVLAATATMADHHKDQVVYSPGEHCQPGMGYPMYSLPRCRALVKRQCVGHGAPGAVDEQLRQDCCRQLAAVDDSWCRCEALNHMVGGIYRELGATDVGHPMAEVFPGCRRGDLERAAASLPAFCNVDIPNGPGGVCYWLGYPRTPRIGH